MAGTLALWVTIDFHFDGFRYGSLDWWLTGRMAAVPGLFFLLLATSVMAGVANSPPLPTNLRSVPREGQGVGAFGGPDGNMPR